MSFFQLICEKQICAIPINIAIDNIFFIFSFVNIVANIPVSIMHYLYICFITVKTYTYNTILGRHVYVLAIGLHANKMELWLLREGIGLQE